MITYHGSFDTSPIDKKRVVLVLVLGRNPYYTPECVNKCLHCVCICCVGEISKLLCEAGDNVGLLLVHGPREVTVEKKNPSRFA